MSLRGLGQVIETLEPFVRLAQAVRVGQFLARATVPHFGALGLLRHARPWVAASLAQALRRPVLYVTASVESSRMVSDLIAQLCAAPVARFVEPNTAFYDSVDPSPDVIAQHSAVLAALARGELLVFLNNDTVPQPGWLDALLATLQSCGVTVQWSTPMTLAQAQDWQRDHPGAWVLDCRGLGAKADWPSAPAPTAGPLRGVRGEVARVYAPDVTLQRPTRLLHPRYPIYIAPKPNHLFVIGATEIESDDLSPASVRSTLELLSAAYAVHPGFAEGRVLELGAQCRPTLPDNLPAVVEAAPRVLQINGLYRHGYLISPAVHDAVIEYLHGGTVSLAQRLGLRFVPSSQTAACCEP